MAQVVSFVVEARDRASEVMERVSGQIERFAARSEEANASIAESARAAAEAMMTSSEKVEASQARATAAARVYQKAMAEQVAAMKEVKAASAQVAEAQRMTAEATKKAAAAAKLSGEERAAAELKAKDAAKAAADATVAASDREAAALKRVQDAEREVALHSADMETASRRATAAQRDQAEAAATSSGRLHGVGIAAGAVAVGVGLIAKDSIKAAASFQESMTSLVTGAGESKDQIDKVRGGILQLSNATGTSSEELARGMYLIESAGHHGAEGLKVLQAAAEGAKVGDAQLSTVADALTSAMNAYGLKSKDATAVTNELVKTVASGKMHMQDLASALGTVLPVAAAAHVSLSQVGGAIATMTAQGMNAHRAAQNLANSIRSLQNPNAQAVKEMEQLGLSSTDVSKNLGTRGLTGTLEMLTKAVTSHMGPAGTVLMNAFNQSKSAAADAQAMFAKLDPTTQKLAQELEKGSITTKTFSTDIGKLSPQQSTLAKEFATTYLKSKSFNDLLKSGSPAAQTYSAALAKMMGGATGLNTALLLTGGNMDTFKENVKSVGEGADKAGKHVEGWDEVQGDFNTKMERAKQSLENTKIAIGSGLLPIVTKMLGVITDVITPLADWIAKHQTLTAITLALVGALGGAIGTFILVATVISKVKTSFTVFKTAIEGVGKAMKGLSVSSPWMIALTALVMIAILIATHWKQTKQIVAAVWAWIKSASQDVAGFFVKVWHDATDFFTEAWNKILAFVRNWWPLLIGIVTGGLGVIIGLVVKYHNQIWSFIVGIWDKIKQFFVQLWNDLVGITKKLWQDEVSGWTKIWQDVSGFAQRIWRDVVQFFTNLWHDVVHIVTRFWQDEVTGWTKIWQDITGFATRIWHDVSQFFTNLWHDVVHIVTRLWQDEVSGWTRIWQDIVQLARNLWHDVTGIWNSIKSGVMSVAGDLWSGLKSGFQTVVGAVRDTWNGLKKVIADPVNFVIKYVYDDAIVPLWNDVAGTFDSKLKLQSLSPISLAGGGPVSGPGTSTSDSIPAMLSTGEFVVNALATAQNLDLLYAINNGYAAGGLVKGYKHGGLLGAIENIGGAITGGLSSAWNAVKKVVLGGLAAAATPIIHGFESLADHTLGTAGFGGVLDSGVHKVGDSLLDFLKGKDKTAFSSSPVHVSGNVISWIQQAMSATGVSGADWQNGLEIIVKYESGGNPNAINNWDSNAAAGDPSRGLAQTIGSTFRAYHQPGTSGNIYDPVANLAAAINYIRSRYGSIDSVPGVKSVRAGGGYVGYDSGGVLPPGLTMAYNGTGRNEYVLTAPQAHDIGGGGQGMTVIINVSDNQLLSSNAMIEFIQQFERFFVQTALPQAGVHIRYQA
ncbi:phage tail tape measure protein [Streptomyces sp. NPDC093261]|uniref:phage tail tape measure protein n=1 Tax=Streptomyces sp. NPDC093261 TaxID=3366037 RepID=UPI00382FA2C4